MATTKSKSAQTKTAAKKPAKKAAVKSAATKTTTKKAAVKKAAPKKSPAKKATSKKAAAKVSTKKAAAKKAVAAPKAKIMETDERRFAKLRKWNIGLAILHGAQAVAVAVLATDFSVPLRTSHLTFNEATETLETASAQFVDVQLAWLIVAFLAMSSVAHLVIAGPWFKRYTAGLSKGINKARWIEYAFSASTMMVAIGFLAGVNSLSLMVAIFGLTAVMNLMGLVMEVHSQDSKSKKPDWLSFWIGSLAGIIPWVIIGIYFISNYFNATGTPPTFVYFIYGSIFLAFNSFAINMYLQYAKKGKWQDYLYGEKVYMILSLVAKSALAWQVFGGTLRP